MVVLAARFIFHSLKWLRSASSISEPRLDQGLRGGYAKYAIIVLLLLRIYSSTDYVVSWKLYIWWIDTIIITLVVILCWKVRIFCTTKFAGPAEDLQASFSIQLFLFWQCEVSGNTLENFSRSTPLVSSIYLFEMVSFLSRVWRGSTYNWP